MSKISCRNCGNRSIDTLFSLGNLNYTGIFKKKLINVPKAKICLVKCKKCHLVQLDQNFNPKIMYGENYGYRTGINSTMSNHVKKVVNILQKKTKLRKNEYVLDIASNDATLLNSYAKNINTFGVDPLVKKYKKLYKNIDVKIANFFDYKHLKKYNVNNKFKIITALAVFYDLSNPNKFLKDVKKILREDGIFYLEFADLLSIIKNNMFDTICHEHLEYYSFEIINNMIIKNNLRIIDFIKTDINGGSIGFIITHPNSKYKTSNQKISLFIKKEKEYKLKNISTYKKFFKRIITIKNKLKIILSNIKNSKLIIHGYGASTKGNVLLQFFDINHKIIDFISDRNPKKNNLYTPGTKIKIIKEAKSRNMKPDYYLVLPWHFKKEILEREKKLISKGTKFIFPLPKVKII